MFVFLGVIFHLEMSYSVYTIQSNLQVVGTLYCDYIHTVHISLCDLQIPELASNSITYWYYEVPKTVIAEMYIHCRITYYKYTKCASAKFRLST